jgi:transcriptional regulator with XRE-family HTH domain
MAKPGGYLYAISAQGQPYIKIGSTQGTVAKRLAALQTGQPFPLHVVASLYLNADIRQIEKHVHAFLGQAQQRGEWFDVVIADERQLEALVVRAVKFVADQEQRRRRAHMQACDATMSFGARLKATREQRGWSAMALAQQADIPYETVYRVEHGTHHAPRLDVVKKLAMALGVSIDYLAELTDNPKPRPRRKPQQQEDTDLAIEDVAYA